ncbi:MAG: tetratricopeptide repeat protein [Pseudomonadota bacterium]
MPLVATAAETQQDCLLERVPERLSKDPLLCEFQTAWSERFGRESYLEAADLARRYLSEAELGGERRAFILQRLADAQEQSGDVEAARQNYALAVELLENDSSDRLDPRLVDPLEGLGRSLLITENAMAAALALERAAHISRVAEGPFNVRQGPIIDELIRAYTRSDRFEQALAAQSNKLESYIRAYGAGDKRVIAGWQQRGELYASAGLYNEAQQAYKQAIRTVRKQEGFYSPSLLPLLDSMAESYLNHGMNERLSRIGIAKMYLERKVIIVKKNRDIDPATRAAVYVQMGNYLQKYSGWEFAISNYRQAWDELGKLAEAEQRRDAYFAEPAVLIGENYLSENAEQGASQSGPGAAEHIEVTLTMDISNYGEPRNIRLDGDSPLPRSTRKRAISIAQKFRFRPRIVDNAAVETRDRRYTLLVPLDYGSMQFVSDDKF